MRVTICRAVLSFSGIAILGSAILHGLVNVPHLRGDLVEIGVRRTLVAAVMLVLYFSVVAMFAFGALVLSSTVGSSRGGYLPRTPLWIISATYVIFGLVAFLAVSPSPHMLGYTGMGLLVAFGAALCPARVADGAPSS
jgi:hypothetical protein